MNQTLMKELAEAEAKAIDSLSRISSLCSAIGQGFGCI